MKLSRRVGSNISVPEAETRDIKTALVHLGLYETPAYGLTPYPDQAMFDGIAALQTRLGVEATGSMLPGGIEELAIGDALSSMTPESRTTSPGTVHVRAYEQTRKGNEVKVVEHDRSAPSGDQQPSMARSPKSPQLHLPTPNGKIRERDKWGDGKFGANRDKGRPHMGVDVTAQPGQPIQSAVSGTVISAGNLVYGDETTQKFPEKKSYTSVSVRTDEGYIVKQFYVSPSVRTGDRVEAGQKIGTSQDLSRAYPGITNHVHIEVWDGKERIDPTPSLYPAR